MALELHPVNPGMLTCLAEETYAAGSKLVVRPEVGFLVLDKCAVPVALYIHGDAVWSVRVDHHAQGRLDAGSLAALNHGVVHHGHHGPRSRLEDGELQGVVIVRTLCAHHPIDALGLDLRHELKSIIGKGHRRPVKRQLTRMDEAVGAVRPASGPLRLHAFPLTQAGTEIVGEGGVGAWGKPRAEVHAAP